MDINWDAFGALAEGLGAVAVVFSVLYLATQIRSQTRESMLSASRELFAESRRLQELIALDQEFAVIYQKGLHDYVGLPDNDRMRVSYIFLAFFRLCEQQYLHTRHTAIDHVYLESSEHVYRAFFQQSGVREYWETGKQIFGEDFVRYAEKLMAEAEQAEYASTFKQDITGAVDASDIDQLNR